MKLVTLSAIDQVFVYGTLKRGQLRAGMWPHPPRSIVPARTRGWLYDLGPHPALLPGDDWISGELWQLDVDHIAHTLQVLDEIEGFADALDDWYRRVVADCQLQDGTATRAYTYHYARKAIPEGLRMRPAADGVCSWPPLGLRANHPIRRVR